MVQPGAPRGTGTPTGLRPASAGSKIPVMGRRESVAGRTAWSGAERKIPEGWEPELKPKTSSLFSPGVSVDLRGT